MIGARAFGPAGMAALSAMALLAAGCHRPAETARPRALTPPAPAAPSEIDEALALGKGALVLCAEPAGRDRKAGLRAAREAAAAAGAAFSHLPPGRKLAERWTLLPPAAEALAECDSPAAAKAFVGAQVDPGAAKIILDRLADKLAAAKQGALAEAVAPPPDPNDAEDLAQSAQRLVKAGRTHKARTYALQAYGLLQASAAQSGRPDPLQDAALAGQLTAVLADVGEYESAMALVRVQAPGDQEPDFLALALHVIDARDRKGVAQVLPVVVPLFATSPASALEGAGDLAEVVRHLAISGFKTEAAEANRALDERRNLLPVWQRLRLQADLGDVDGAIAAANRLGPLTQPVSPMAGVFAAAMALGDSGAHNVSREKVMALARKVQEGQPTQTSAPRAEALAAIATDLADAGRIQDALRAEAPLDTVPPETVANSRDYALAAIAAAQIKAGKTAAARQTIARIYQPAVRSEAERKLG